MSRRRLAWTIGGGLLLVAAVMVWAIAERRLHRLAMGVAVESWTFFGQPAGRVSHRASPLSGNVVDALERELAVLAAGLAELPDPADEPFVERCAAVRDGRWPVGDLPRPCRDVVETMRPVLVRLTSVAEHAALGEAWRFERIPGWVLAQASSVAATMARIDLEERDDPAAAVRTCVGLLALWKDASHAAALARATSLTIVIERSEGVCRDALRRCDGATRARARRQLEAIQRNLAPMARAVQRERHQAEVALFLPRLPTGLPAGLHRAAAERASRATVVESRATDPRDPRWLAPLVLPGSWIGYRTLMDGFADLVDGEPEAAVAEIEARLASAELEHLLRTAATARWREHVIRQANARIRLASLLQIAAAQAN